MIYGIPCMDRTDGRVGTGTVLLNYGKRGVCMKPWRCGWSIAGLCYGVESHMGGLGGNCFNYWEASKLVVTRILKTMLLLRTG